ncbi:type IV pilin [Halocatena pleomorpha]|uniref:Type IV pilin n=1 Tax=Halocatena pleomorpha TaxID=1785090 RepID=A0A3P3RBJ3_9EURY|nr:type IV pilin N-terminal domain-containing protein [Halocatena pleomorpha]RRJ30765.1 type IV pilin [Halocatena pleomorpha]
MSDRGVSTVVGIIVLVGITIVLAGAFGAMVLTQAPPSEPPQAVFALTADSATQTITLTHESGADLTPETLRLTIAVDGEPIAHQPPIPFFAAKGFIGGPTGPFNSAYEGNWTAGQSASLRVASTNTQFQAGTMVTVRLYAADQLVASLETRV